MSRMTQPNYCSCTVHQARNLPDKGKSNGIDAFCTISMGKEKFVTAVREKTRSPEWQEQCEMPIADDATIKLTVYHNTKNALSKGDFVGRTYVSLRDLQDYDRIHRHWYKLTNKDGKNDKERGEIDVSLQFFSKNDTTGSVLDLATKKKHLSLKDIKHSLGGKLKTASKHRKQDNYGGDNQSTSFAGSHMSLNSMSYNNHVEPQHKKSMSLNRREDDIPRAPSSGLGSILGTGTPHSSRRSITSDYDTSSILDSASMYGGEEPSSSSPPIRSQVQQQQQQREVYVGDDLPPRSNSTRRKSKEPSPSTTLPTIVTPKTTNNSPPLRSTDHNRSFSVTGDDIEAAFDAINDYKTLNNESKDYDNSAHDSLFGLSTIKEATDTDEVTLGLNSPKTHTDEEMDDIDFDNCLNKYKRKHQTKVIEEKPPKPSTPSTPVHQKTSKPSETKSVRSSNETKRPAPVHTEDIRTPLASIPTPNVTPSSLKVKDTIEKNLNDPNDSGDEDVDELLGKLERMSSIRSSVKRKIQPKDDIMQQSFSELDTPTNNQFFNGYGQNQSSPFTHRNDRNSSATLPDIVGEQSSKNLRPGPNRSSISSTISNNIKTNDNGLCVLGYENVKSTPVHPKVRQELDYLDREELLHVIAYQSDLLKKRDTRLKDLENYTDSLLVKILEQCPTILQVGTSSSTSKYR